MLRCVIARGSTLDGTVPESAPTFAQRVGGRWVISWQAYTLGATFNTVLLGLTGGSVGAESVSLSDFPRWCALGALASAAVGIYALDANATVFRHKRRTPAALPISVAFHASVGLLFAAVVVGCAGIFRLEPPSPAWTFLLATSGIALWWGLTMASLFEGRERFRLRRQALLERAVEGEFAALIAADASTEFEDRVRAEVSAVLSDTHTELMKQLPSSENDAAPHTTTDRAPDSEASTTSWGSVADSLRETARDSVRPLSHRLWISTEEQYPAPRVFDVLVRTVRHPQPAPLASFFIVLLGYLRASFEAFGPLLGVGAAVLLATSVAVVLYGIRWIPAAAATPTFWLVFVLCEVAGLAFLSLAPHHDRQRRDGRINSCDGLVRTRAHRRCELEGDPPGVTARPGGLVASQPGTAPGSGTIAGRFRAGERRAPARRCTNDAHRLRRGHRPSGCVRQCSRFRPRGRARDLHPEHRHVPQHDRNRALHFPGRSDLSATACSRPMVRAGRDFRHRDAEFG